MKTVIIREMFLTLLYPKTCILCGRLTGQRDVCQSCEKKLAWIPSPRCLCCGRPIASETEEYCEVCRGTTRNFDGGRGIFLYHSSIRKAVLDLKNHGRRQNATALGDYMAAAIRPLLLVWQPDVILPIPLDAVKYRKRGYNQAELLALQMGRRLKLPVRRDLLYKEGSKREQKNLNRLERRKNLEKAFKVKPAKGKRLPSSVLLVDDIYTTGSTIEAAAGVLKAAGVKRVYFVTACMGGD